MKNIVGPLYPLVLHLQIQPNANGKYLGIKIPESFEKQNFDFFFFFEDQTLNLMVPSWIRFHCTTTGTLKSKTLNLLWAANYLQSIYILTTYMAFTYYVL